MDSSENSNAIPLTKKVFPDGYNTNPTKKTFRKKEARAKGKLEKLARRNNR